MENTTEKRVVKKQESKGLSLKDIILVAVLLAVGAVLKFFVGSVINFGGMKPNFIIAMYCLFMIQNNANTPRTSKMLSGYFYTNNHLFYG